MCEQIACGFSYGPLYNCQMEKYYNKSIITYQKISKNFSYPLSHPCVIVAQYQMNGYSECVNFLSSGTKKIMKKGVRNSEWLN